LTSYPPGGVFQQAQAINNVGMDVGNAVKYVGGSEGYVAVR